MHSIHNQRGVFLVLLDLSAAFDTVEHNILVTRMANEIGLTGTALAWYKSYFSNRSTKVSINDTFSSCHHMEYGLPQGSIVGPGSFKIHIIPIGRIIKKHQISYHMYADDIQLFHDFIPSDKDSVDRALSRLSSCICDIKRWMTINMLKLNDSKTELFIAISPRNKCKLPDGIKLRIGEEWLYPSATVRNLGVVFDSNLTMSSHITNLCKSLIYHLRNISRIRRYLDKNSCHHIIRSLILTRLDYANAMLLGTNSKNIARLQKMQNWAAKIILCAKKRDHATPLIKHLHWLNVRNRKCIKLWLRSINA